MQSWAAAWRLDDGCLKSPHMVLNIEHCARIREITQCHPILWEPWQPSCLAVGACPYISGLELAFGMAWRTAATISRMILQSSGDRLPGSCCSTVSLILRD